MASSEINRMIRVICYQYPAFAKNTANKSIAKGLSELQGIWTTYIPLAGGRLRGKPHNEIPQMERAANKEII